jgi:hypothetical protein
LSEFFTVMDLKKYFWASLFLAIICLAGAVLAVMSSGDADIYIKEKISGTGSGTTLHEGRLGESVGFKDATVAYSYDKTVDESGTHEQNVEFMLSGGDGSYWNFQKIWTDKQIAGHNSMTVNVGQISGSYYGKSGMKISYNEANESREEFESTITIDTRDGNATISFDVIQWQGGGEPIPQYDEETGNFTGYEGGESMGKPVSMSELDLVGGFLVEQVVRLKEPITDNKGWLEFCGDIDKDDKMPDGYIIKPSGNNLTDFLSGIYPNAEVYQVDV